MFTRNRIIIFNLCILFILSFQHAFAVDSIQLTDVVKSNGQGNIDLLKDISAELLEDYRLEGNGTLIFAIDVNEAADGTEKADSQGLAIDSATLSITMEGVVSTYEVFSSETQADLV
ncbi:MAG: hypothetical protein HQM12_15850 [SAR324 cluster bacterium]|nr:hypothetical protein [SAR324 cluster bacterium]